MRASYIVLLLAAALAGCDSADAWDSSNPVQCMTVFSLASSGAAAQGDTAMANNMNARMLGIVDANGGIAWLEQIKPETHRIAAKIEAAGDDDVVKNLLEECIDRHRQAD